MSALGHLGPKESFLIFGEVTMLILPGFSGVVTGQETSSSSSWDP